MDLTQGSNIEKNNRAKKMMLWFGIASLLMSFGGLTSAFIASKTRVDWVADLQLPNAFSISLAAIVISSIILFLSKKSLKNSKLKKTTFLFSLVITLGFVFVGFQFYGFNQLIDSGNYFTGPTSNVTSSFIFLIAFFHLLHVLVGLLCLLVVFVKLLYKKYDAKNMMGFELASYFWHFVDFLWIYLFLFLVFFI
jgi:cytochrome c oxidase subunit 3